MAQVRLKVTKGGIDGYIRLGVGTDHRWQLERQVPWLDAMQGKWQRGTTASKFQQYVYIELMDERGKGLMRIKNSPHIPTESFKASLLDHFMGMEMPGESVSVLVLSGPPAYKAFKIRQSWGGSLAFTVAQTEWCGFEIGDTITGETQTYSYRGVGLTIGPPIKKLPNIPGSVGTAGPWNDFQAPGWMTVRDFAGDATLSTIYNAGMGSDKSMNVFDFAGGIDGNPQCLVHLTDFSTGRSFSLPSSGISVGHMSRR